MGHEVDKQQSGYNIPRRTKMWRNGMWTMRTSRWNTQVFQGADKQTEHETTKYTTKAAQIFER